MKLVGVDVEQVLKDVLDGYISVETTAPDYGVVVNQRMTIDRDVTAKLRSGI